MRNRGTSQSGQMASILGAGYAPVSWQGTVGEADIYVAERDGREVLVKHLAHNRPRYEVLRRQLLEEGKLASELKHDNLLGFRAAIESRTGVSLVFDHPGGINVARLTDVLRGRGEAVPFDVAMHITLEAARATDRVRFRTGVPVRSLAPEHVIITDRGVVMLATHQLGLIRLAVVQDEPTDPDLFALGRLFVTMLVGEKPKGKALLLAELAEEGVPAELVDIVLRATSPNGYVDVGEMIVDLQRQGRRMTSHHLARLFWENGLFSEDVVRILPPPDIQDAITTEDFVPIAADFDQEPTMRERSTTRRRSRRFSSISFVPPGELEIAVRASTEPDGSESCTRPEIVLPTPTPYIRPGPYDRPPHERSLGSQVRGLFDEQPPSIDVTPNDVIHDLDEPAPLRRRPWWMLGIVAFVLALAVVVAVSPPPAPKTKLVGTKVSPP